MLGREILLFNKIVSIIAGYFTVVCSDSIKLNTKMSTNSRETSNNKVTTTTMEH